MRKRPKPKAIGLVLALCVLLTSTVLTAGGCAGNPTPKVVVSTADRAAYEAIRAFQVAEESAYHAKLPWPTDQQHRDINAKVSQAYTLVIDVANLGLALPPGGKLTAADLAAVGQLTQAVADIVALAAPAPPNVQQAALTAQAKAQALASSVGGQ